MRYRYLFCMLSLLFSGCKSVPEGRLSGDEAGALMADLTTAVRNSAGWEQVHAAEFLIDLGAGGTADSIFSIKANRNADTGTLRLGIWRVLAMTQKENGKWLDSLREMARTGSLRERETAVESLAKLGDASVGTPVTDSVAGAPVSALRVLELWRMSGASDQTEILLKIALAEHQDIRTRRLAAYALQYMKTLSPDQRSRLIHYLFTAARVPGLSSYLAGAAYAGADQAFRTREEFLSLKRYIEQLVAEDPALLKILGPVLAGFSSPAVQAFLIKQKERITPGDTTLEDARISLNYALLKLFRLEQKTLSILDWVVIAVYLIGMILIGWYYLRRNKNTEDYLLGGRKMNPVAVGISLFAGLLSTLSYLSYPGEMIKHGPVIFTGMLAFPFVYFVIGWWIMPKIMKLNVTSAHEILEMRFGLNVRMLAVLFFLLLRMFWMATIMYVTVNIALFSIVPIDQAYAPLFGIAIMVTTIIYTSMGGMKAVVVTDVVQSVILITGLVVCIAVVSYDFGSLHSWIPAHWVTHWSSFKIGFDATERLTVGNAVLMLFLWYICTDGGDQTAIQRYLSTTDVKAARKSLRVSLGTNLIAKCLLALVGLALLAYFSKNTHLLGYEQSLTRNADRLFPRFILVSLPSGLSGLLIAALLSAAMSCLSSGLNAVSTVVSEDILKRFRVPFFNGAGAIGKIRILSCLVGSVVIVLSLSIGKVDGNLIDIANKVVNLFVAPLFVLFFMAFFVPFARSWATMIAGLCAIATGILVAFYHVFQITILWVIPTSLFVGITVGVFLSFLGSLIKKPAK